MTLPILACREGGWAKVGKVGDTGLMPLVSVMVVTGDLPPDEPGTGAGRTGCAGAESGWLSLELCPHLPRETYHPHLGEVDQAVLCVIGCPLLDEGQVSEVHPQVRDTGWVTTWKQMASTKIFHLRKGTSAKNRTPCMQILPV